MDRDELAHQIYRSAHLTGRFVLRSGATSDEYFDKYRFEADPALLAVIAPALAGLVPEGTEILAGLELGGVPLATALSLHTGIPACFVRKEAKDYGTCKLAEGADIAGKRVTVIEDVVFTGGQVVMSTADLRAAGAIVTAAVVVIDRTSDGAVALSDAGLELRALYQMSELTEV